MPPESARAAPVLHPKPMCCAAQMAPLYLAAMDAIHAASPSTTFLVEGTGQTAFPGLNWGDGFVTDRALIKQYGLSDANLFFGALLSKPYLNLVGVSPHVYPPSVTFQSTVRPLLSVWPLPSAAQPLGGRPAGQACQGSTLASPRQAWLKPFLDWASGPQNYQGAGLWYRMWTSFGYLNTIGYAKHLFPIVMVRGRRWTLLPPSAAARCAASSDAAQGETGSFFATATDIQSMADIAAYVRADPGTGTAHNPLQVRLTMA